MFLTTIGSGPTIKQSQMHWSIPISANYFGLSKRYTTDTDRHICLVRLARMLGYGIVVKVTQKCHQWSHKRS